MIPVAWGHAIGWAILHCLWEGAAVALLLAVFLSVTHSSQIRYVTACLALLAIMVAFSVTVVRERPRQTIAASVRIYHSAVQDEQLTSFSQPFHRMDPPQYIALIWIVGVVLFHLRTLVSWIATQRLRKHGVCGVPEFWQQRFIELSKRLRLDQPVVLLESCLTRVPVMVGYLRPVILIPVGMLASMSPSQVEAILLHELAHVRRRDYLVNLLQAAAENFLFYHPAVWWISGVIRREREYCCDDLAVTACGNAGEYARALTSLESNRWTANNAVLAANGGNLMKRIIRILYPQEAKQTGLVPVFLAGVLTLLTAIALSAWQPSTADSIPQPYQKWLNEDVLYIMDANERAAFLHLTTDPEREHFIEQFWELRDPTPGTALNEFKEEHYRRIAYANGHYTTASGVAGWKTDRGRIYISFGWPDELETHPASQTGGAPYESWLYYKINGIGERVIMQFVDQNGKGDYQMTKDPHATKQEQQR